MSTAVLGRRSIQRKITVALVRAVLEDIAARYPGRVDRRASDEVPARYVEADRPSCLVAVVLDRLGFSIGVLKTLDVEHAVGELCTAGVRVAESRHPALRRIDPAARALLQWVQDQQDAGREWGAIVSKAFGPSRWFARRDRDRRPWLYA